MMAQKQKRKRSKKWVSWVILLVLLIGAGVVVYLVWDNYFNDKKDKDTQETVQISEKNEEEKSGGGDVVEKKKVEQYEGDDPNNAETLSGVVTYAGVNDGVLMVRVNIDQYLDSGECGLTLVRGGATIYNSIANIVGNVSTATCEGFDVPVGGLGGGETDININVKSGERSGVIHGKVSL